MIFSLGLNTTGALRFYGNDITSVFYSLEVIFYGVLLGRVIISGPADYLSAIARFLLRIRTYSWTFRSRRRDLYFIEKAM